MIDYLAAMAGTEDVVTLSDNKRNRSDLYFEECNRLVRKIHHMFYWDEKHGRRFRFKEV